MQLLEYLEPEDARMVVGMKDKVMIYPGITEELVRKTFPGLLTFLPGEVMIEDKKEALPKPKSDGKHLERNNAKVFKCPIDNCEAIKSGATSYSKGNFLLHMRAKHKWTNEQVEAERNRQMIIFQARNG